jgi:hypothetical protein
MSVHCVAPVSVQSSQLGMLVCAVHSPHADTSSHVTPLGHLESLQYVHVTHVCSPQSPLSSSYSDICTMSGLDSNSTVHLGLARPACQG